MCINLHSFQDTNSVPETPLMSARILNEEADMWVDKKVGNYFTSLVSFIKIRHVVWMKPVFDFLSKDFSFTSLWVLIISLSLVVYRLGIPFTMEALDHLHYTHKQYSV